MMALNGSIPLFLAKNFIFMENILEKTLEKMVSLSKEAEQVLVEYVNSHGGEIDTSNDDMHKDTIWAFIWDEIDETYSERKVTSVKTFNDRLLIQVDYPLSTEEDGWYAVYGGLVIINATLFNLLECLSEYVE
jgi:hypothetical protein